MPKSPWHGLTLQVPAMVEITICFSGSELVIEPLRVMGARGLQVAVAVAVRVVVGVVVWVGVEVWVGVGVGGGQP